MLTTLRFPPDVAPAVVADRIKSVWKTCKVIHISGPKPQGDLRDYYWKVLTGFGYPVPMAEDVSLGDRNRQRTGSYWTAVRYEPGIEDAYRHSPNAQPLHTDGSYCSGTGLDHDLAPGAVPFGFLGCVSMSDDGGATTFVDGVDVIEALREEDPELLARVESVEVPHARSGDRRVHTIIRYEDGVPKTNWNYYCVDQEASDEVKRLREDFFRFVNNSPAIKRAIQSVKLGEGDAVIWRDEETLHGREAFNPKAPAERFLWKTAMMVEP